MDYKNKYEDAIERYKKVFNFNNLAYSHEEIREKHECAFPELKESDGERIRKELLYYIQQEKNYIESQVKPENSPKLMFLIDAVAWLEKQGEQKLNSVFDIDIPFGAKDSELQEVSYCIPEGFYAEIDKNKVVIKKVEQKFDSNCLLSWSEIDEKMLQSLEGIVKDYWAKAEREKNEIKIREASNVSFFLKTIQKSPLCWIKCSDGLPNRDGTYLVVTDGRHNDVYDIARYDSIEGWHKASEIIYWMPIPQLNNKSIIEQKSTEKVEPKFKVEDWIVYNNNLYHIGNIALQRYYECLRVDGTVHTFDLDIDSKSHLWTIQDAKEGDVLYTSSTASHEIFIFKGLSKGGNIECYCSYDSEDKYCDGEYHFIGKPTFMTHPASKEQGDLLFAKMKEAGYEWNAEKKELKKLVKK